MKKLLIVLIAVIASTSCGKTVKELHRETVHDNSTTTTKDLSVTITAEKIDTGIKIPGFTVTGVVNLDTNANDTSFVIVKEFTNNAGVKLSVKFDKKKKTITASATKDSTTIPVKLDRTTTTHKNVATTQQNDISKKTTDKHVTHDYSVVAKWITIGVVVIVVIALFWFFGLPKLRKK